MENRIEERRLEELHIHQEKKLEELHIEQSRNMELILKRLTEQGSNSQQKEDKDDLREKESNRHTDKEEEPSIEPSKLGINQRIELPTLEGEDICEWLVCIERYFRLARVTTAEK